MIIEAGDEDRLLQSTVHNLNLWLEGGFLPAWAKQAIAELVDKGAWDELNDRSIKNMLWYVG